MSYKSMFRAMFAASLMCFSVAVLASASSNIGEIVQQQRELRAQIQADEFDLDKRERRKVLKDQDRIFEMAEGRSSVDDLDPDEQVEFRNAIERIAAAIADTRADREEREICWRERQSGTKIMKTVCGSETEVAEARSGAREFLQRPRVCVPPGCGQ